MTTHHICFSTSGRLAAVALTLGLAFAKPIWAAGPLEQTISIDISAGTSMEDALLNWSRQTGVQIMMATETVKYAQVQAFHGSAPAGSVLMALLRNSGLGYTIQGNTVHIVPEGALFRSSLHEIPGSDAHSMSASDENASSVNTPSPDDTGQSNTTTAEPVSEVVETGYNFLSADTSGTTNLPIPIEKVPQSISIVSDDFIKAADLKTLSEIAEYTPGAVNAGNDLGLGTIIKLRGFGAGQAIDGLTTNSGVSLFEPDYAIYDRLEVVKGPTSVVYGVSNPGGLVNFVTKSATPRTPSYFSAQFGSWDTYRIDGQLATPVFSFDSLRAIAVVVQDHGNSFTDHVSHTKTTLYGGLNFSSDESLSAYLHGGYERFVRTTFDGIPTEADGSAAPVARSFFIGNSNMALTSPIYHLESGLTWRPTNIVDVSVKANYQHIDTTGISPYASGLTQTGEVNLGIETFAAQGATNYGLSASSTIHFDELGLNNSFVTFSGVRLISSSYYREMYYGGSATANIFDGEAALASAFESLLMPSDLSPYDYSQHAATTVLSMQSILQPIEHLSLLMGASDSKADEANRTNFTTVPSDETFSRAETSGRVSYRAGLTYGSSTGTNAYVSFSQSFVPQLGLSLGNVPLEPLTGTQYEVGVKYRSPGSHLLLTGALFEIKQQNLAEYAATVNDVDYSETVGAVTNKGIELQALGQISDSWQINIGASYLDPKIVDDKVTQLVGQTQLYLPRQTYSSFTTYTIGKGILHGLTIGGGARYIGSEMTSYSSPAANAAEGLSPTRNIAGYFVVDGTLSYTVEKWLLQLNAHNLLNRRYYVNNYGTLFYGNTVGEPLNVALTVRREF